MTRTTRYPLELRWRANRPALEHRDQVNYDPVGGRPAGDVVAERD